MYLNYNFKLWVNFLWKNIKFYYNLWYLKFYLTLLGVIFLFRQDNILHYEITLLKSQGFNLKKKNFFNIRYFVLQKYTDNLNWKNLSLNLFRVVSWRFQNFIFFTLNMNLLKFYYNWW